MSSIDEELSTSILALFKRTQSIALATSDEHGHPDISYCPYLLHNGNLYIFISELAAHTINLRHRPALSLMLIEDESSSSNIFARQRISLKGQAKFISRSDKQWRNILNHFEQQRGETIKVLRELPDFHLVKIEAGSGRFVKGFAQAYDFSPRDLDHFLTVKN